MYLVVCAGAAVPGRESQVYQDASRKVCRRVGRGVPSIHSDRACRRHRATRGTAAIASVARRRRHHLQLHCRLVDFNLLGLTSVPDPIMNMIELDHSC